MSLDELREFLESVTRRRPSGARIPPLLFALARGRLRRTPWAGNDAAVEDVVGAFLEALCGQTRRGTAASAERLLELDDAALLAAVSHRIGCVAAESSPGWLLVRQLRAHVRAAEPGPAPLSPPTRLVAHGRIAPASVALAARWYRARPGQSKASAAEVAGWMLETYFPPDAPLDGALQAGNDPGPALEAACLAQTLRARLGAEELSLIEGKVAGLPLRELASRREVAVSTVFQQLEVATARARAVLSGLCECGAAGD